MSYDTIELHRLDHVQVRIVRDPEPSNPREDDNLGTMVCWHRRYRLGDEHHYDAPEEFVTDIIGEATAERIERWYDRQYQKIAGPYGSKEHTEARAALAKEYHDKRWAEVEKVALVLPLYLFDHSGITIRTTPFNDSWDSMRVGYVYVTRADARKEYGRLTKKRIDEALELLRIEVATYDEYLTGQVYGFVVESLPSQDEIDDDGDDAEGDHLDSCWGFYGGIDYVRTEAMDSARCQNDQHATPTEENT